MLFTKKSWGKKTTTKKQYMNVVEYLNLSLSGDYQYSQVLTSTYLLVLTL